jgi:tetratricopeptide (TPR) repeat protein
MLLRHSAVLGGQQPLGALAAMLGVEPEALADDLGRLGHFVSHDGKGTVRFRHILLRDVAYEGLSFRVRRDLHERAGQILESTAAEPEAMAELLSIHFHRAGHHSSAWRYALVAAERARHNGASVEAAGFYDVALEAAAHLPDISAERCCEVAEQLGDACELSGRYERSASAYLRARKLATGRPATRARLCRKLGYVRDHEGRYAAAERWFASGRAELVEVADPADAARLRAELTTATVSSRIRQGRHGKARPLIDAAIEAAEASGDRAALAHAYFVLDQLLVDQGRYSEARHSEQAAAIYEELGDDRGAAAAYNEVGNTAYWLGRWDEAVASYERAIEADRRAGALVYLAIYLNNIGEIRSDQGRWDEARSLLEEAHGLWTAGGWRIGSGWALSNRGRLAARAGRLEESAELLARSIELFGAIGADAMLLETEVREMERLVLAGDHAGALGLADPLEERARKMAIPNVANLVQRIAGYAWAQAGQPEAGWALLDSCLENSRKADAEYEAALTLEAMVRVGRLLGRGDLDVVQIEVDAIFDRLGVVATPEVPGLG